jgi:hypothetical protein
MPSFNITGIAWGIPQFGTRVWQYFARFFAELLGYV